jgi:hypothetical protein
VSVSFACLSISFSILPENRSAFQALFKVTLLSFK